MKMYIKRYEIDKKIQTKIKKNIGLLGQIDLDICRLTREQIDHEFIT